MRVTSLAGHPVEQYSSPNVGGRMTGHRGPVLHIAQGYYEGTINWQLNPNQQYRDGTRVRTCSTWIVGPNRGEIAQMADSDTVAWCQMNGSLDRTSIELAGFAPNPPTAWQIEACAHLLVWEHRTYGVPLAIANDPSGRGLGHHSMDREWLGEEWGHEACPGSGVIAAKAAIVARALAIAGGAPSTEKDDDMPNFRNYQVPAGFAYDENAHLIDRGKLLERGLPVQGEANGNAALPWGPLFLTASTYVGGGGSTRLVVSVHNGTDWAVREEVVEIPEGGRHALPFPEPGDQSKGWGYQVLIGRARKSATDTVDNAPTSVLLEIGEPQE